MNNNNQLTIKVSDDKLQAYLYLQDSLPIARETIYNLLQSNNIIFGIQEETINQLIPVNNSSKEYLIAQAIPAQNGKDSQTIFHFNTIQIIDREPLKREDDSVDYHNKGTIDYVESNEVIAENVLATNGINGTNVYGKQILATNGKTTTIRFDKTVSFSSNDNKFRSLIEGHPILRENMINIQKELEVKNVDFSTGNIFYKGDIFVRENIRSGFCIKTDKNIEIKGSIHHSEISAGENIVCHGGKIPGEEGSIQAGGNITITFIDGGTINAGNNLIIQKHLINTQAIANNSILCDEKEGLILGGTVVAKELIQTFDLGSPNETKTEVILDNLTERLEKLKEIDATQKTINKELLDGLPTYQRLEKLIKNKHFIDNMNKEQMDRILNTFSHLHNTRTEKQQNLANLGNQKREILQSIKYGKSPELHIYGTVYPKVQITINHIQTHIKSPLTNIKFSVFNNEIQIHTLKPTNASL